jgi:quinohemoprotein ethanol dehydrogenase
MTTAGGLVFQGTADGRFVAYDATDGNKVWETNVGSGVIASPVTYLVDGKQYVSVAVGWGGLGIFQGVFTKENYPGTIFTFALNAKGAPPDFYSTKPKELIALDFTATKEELSKGANLFAKYCSVCHGLSSPVSVLPHLTYSKEETFSIFDDIVLKGLYLKKGMPNFGDRLSQEDAYNIKSFILNKARELRTVQNN